MRPDFCVMILTHGRPANVKTYAALLRHGYTGKVYLVVDDEDKTADAYRARYGNQVLTFSKKAIAERFDEADNFTDRRAVFYARNASFELAEAVGCRYFIQLDDDYGAFLYRRQKNATGIGQSLAPKGRKIKNLDGIFTAMVEFLRVSQQVSAVAMSQGGDLDHIRGFIGAADEALLKRKAMNSFVCDTHKPFPFLGRLNEDVSTYVSLGRRGLLFFTSFKVQLTQAKTQQTEGGMTELYLAAGTYVKSFYTVMREPSCVKIAGMGYQAGHYRLHHVINWNAAVPKIIRSPMQKQHDKQETYAGAYDSACNDRSNGFV